MKLLLAITAMSVVALGAAPHASAKGCVRIDAPVMTTVGARVRIVIRTYASVLERGRVVPGAPMDMAIPRFRVLAEGPRDRTIEVIARRLGRSSVRVAWVSFPARGRWRLRAANWLYAPRTCAPPAWVRVEQGDPRSM